MEFRIFNVGHGFCALLIADNGNVILFDCGHDDRISFRPSRYLSRIGCTAIEKLIISNYDEDHLSDLPNLKNVLPIQTLHRNRSISPQSLHRLKLQGGPLGFGVKALLEMLNIYTADALIPPDFAGVELSTFYNPYPTFQDTNNLSLVSFVRYSNLSIIIPGDMEQQGWRALLNKRDFRDHLKRVNIFIASHHGRESGYLREIFEFCQPDIVIISDESKRYQTQETNYAVHARGLARDDGGMRYVLTTRKDGNISITKRLGESYQITTGV